MTNVSIPKETLDREKRLYREMQILENNLKDHITARKAAQKAERLVRRLLLRSSRQWLEVAELIRGEFLP